MKAFDLAVVVITLGLAFYVVLFSSPLGFGCAFGLSGYTTFLLSQSSTSVREKPIVKFGGLQWSREDFCRG